MATKPIVDPEPTDEMIEALLIATGITGKLRAATMEAVQKHRGGPNEPCACSQARAVLAIVNGVTLHQINRGYRPSARKPK